MKNVFITGGTTGIGHGLAETYLKMGLRVGICGRDLTKLDANWVKQYPKLHTYECDVTELQQIKKVVSDFTGDGTLDLMIANAGLGDFAKSTWPNFELSRKILDVNIFGVLNSVDAAMEHMKKQKSGHLVAIASVAGFVGLPGASSYCASKAAVLRLFESYTIDLKQFGIDVTSILPGYIETPLTAKNRHPMPFILTCDYAVKKIAGAIAKKRTYFVFPLRMSILMFIVRLLPKWIYFPMMRRVKKLAMPHD